MSQSPRTYPVWAIMLVLGVAEVTCAFESTMIFAALGTVYKVYADPIGVGWLLTAFLLVSAAAAPLCARLGDMRGRRRVLLWILVVSGIGSAISAVAPSLGWVVAGRALQGVSAAVLPLCYGLLREYLPKERVPGAVGIIAATAFGGAGLGVLLGGLIVDNFPWQTIFYVSTAFTMVATVMVYLVLPRSAPAAVAGSIDFWGSVLFAPAIGLILFAITKGTSWGWTDPWTIGLIGAGVLVLAVWARHELCQDQPMIDLRLLGNRQILLANLIMAFVAVGAIQVTQIIFLLLQQPSWTIVGLGVSATVAGLVKIPSNVIALMGAPWSGWIAARQGARAAALYGAALMIIGWIGLTLHHSAIWFIVVVTLVTQLGMSVVYAAVPNLIIEAAPQDRTSEATGLLQVSRAIFGAIGAQMATFLLATSTISDPTHGPGKYPSESAFTLTMIVITGTCIAGFLITLLLPRRRIVPAPRTASLQSPEPKQAT
jgi:MFS family permease